MPRGEPPDPRIRAAVDPAEHNWRTALSGLSAVPGAVGARALGEVVRLRMAAGTAEDDDPRLREALGLLAERAGSEEAASEVSFALRSRDAGVRYAAAEALGSIGVSSSGPRLQDVLESDGEPLVAAAALNALVALRGAALEVRLRSLLTDQRASVRSVAARSLFKIARPPRLASAPADAVELHTIRLLWAAKRRDLRTIQDFMHPMRRLEITENRQTQSFGASTMTPSIIRRDVAPLLGQAFDQVDSLICGAPRGIERRCAVYDSHGYVTEIHFAVGQGDVFLVRIKRHGGYADL